MVADSFWGKGGSVVEVPRDLYEAHELGLKEWYEDQHGFETRQRIINHFSWKFLTPWYKKPWIIVLGWFQRGFSW